MIDRTTVIVTDRSDFPFSLMLDSESYGFISREEAEKILNLIEVAQSQEYVELGKVVFWKRFKGLSEAPCVDLGGTRLVAFHGNFLQSTTPFFAMIGPRHLNRSSLIRLKEKISNALESTKEFDNE